MKNLELIKKKLPYGSIQRIAAKTHLSGTTVCHVLNGRVKSPRMPDIVKAAAEIISEYQIRERDANKALNEVLQD